MRATRDDFQRTIEQGHKKAARSRETDLRVLTQAAPPMQRLTESKEWNYFLSLVQAEIERCNSILVGLYDADISDPSFDHAAMAGRKALRMRIAAQKDALESVLALPAEIIKRGEEATIALRNYVE